MLRSVVRPGVGISRRSFLPLPSASGGRYAIRWTQAARCFQQLTTAPVSPDYPAGSRPDNSIPLSLHELANFLEAQSLDKNSHEARPLEAITTPGEDVDGQTAQPSWDVEDEALDTEAMKDLGWRSSRPKETGNGEQDVAADREELFAALKAQDPARLLSATTAAFQHDEIIQSLSPATVHEVFRTMDLEGVVMRYHAIAQQLSPNAIGMAAAAGSPVRQVTLSLRSLHAAHSRLVKRWQTVSQELSPPIYSTMLRLSALIGDAGSARSLKDMMKKNGHQLDVNDTNSYLRAICWNNVYGRNYIETRNTSTTWRQQDKRGYDISLKSEALFVFDELIENGHAANAETFCLLVLAMGRIGDLDGVANLLDKIWDIKVPKVLKGDSDAKSGNVPFQPTNPLYPNQELLFTLVHVYSINNRFPDALRLVDHVAIRFDLPTSTKVWEELARWCFILSIPRTATSPEWRLMRNKDLSRGQVQPHVLEELWKTLRSPPYNVTPTLAMWDWRLKALWRNRTPLKWMRLFRELVPRLGLKDLAWPSAANASSIRPRQTFRRLDAIAIDRELALLEDLVKVVFAFKWIRLHLSVRMFVLDENWFSRRIIPQIVDAYKEIWCRCTQRALHYRTPTGRVHFHRHMLRMRVESTEVFALGNGIKMARPLRNALQLPYTEKTWADRKNDVARQRYNEGTAPPQTWNLEWYETNDVQNWLWFEDGTGIVVPGMIQDDQRRFHLNAKNLENLPSNHRYEVRTRLMSQYPFVYKSIYNKSENGPAPKRVANIA